VRHIGFIDGRAPLAPSLFDFAWETQSEMPLALPFFVAGRRWDASGPTLDLPMPTGDPVRLPQLTDRVVDAIVALDRWSLASTPLHEIVAFLANVGHNWKATEYARRRLYVRQLVRHLGYSEKMAEAEANWIALLLSSHYRIYDTLAAELGSWHLVDGWVEREEALVRAWPHGRSLHVLPGNVPLSGVASLVRALVTKNTCVLKASSDDPITPVSLALSFADVDPEHPVCRAVSVVHWPGRGGDSPQARRLARDADVVCAWGGEEAIGWAVRNARPEAEVLKFGPRRSLAVVGRGAPLERTARALAHDVCMYDQRACFSMQHAFVEEPASDFICELERAFEGYAKLLPRGVHDFDEQGAWSLSELEAHFSGADVRSSPDRAWSIVVSAPSEMGQHPLGRTLYVHPVADAAEAAAAIGPDVQTVAVAPYTLAARLRDVCAARGAARLVEIGMNNVFRVGGAHDGVFPLQRLVRFVSAELPASERVKGITVPIDQTTFLENDRFVEFIP
jgi:long-chain-fatty-acyl-CoA reductase